MDIVARPIRKLPILGRVKCIEFYSNDKLIAHCEVTRQRKSLGEFELVKTNTVDSVTVKFKDKLREEFEIVDNIEKYHCACDFLKSDSMTIKSEKFSGEFFNHGLIYLSDKCIGRLIKKSQSLFGLGHTSIEVKDETHFNLLVSITLATILQDRVYRIHDWGD